MEASESSSTKSGRSYSERAWTFQELSFAKRRLIIDEGPIKWHCNCAGWSEQLMYHDLADFQDRRVPELWDATQWMNAKIPNLSHLTDIIRYFNQKVLTYPEDVLPAFSGIQSMLHRIYPEGLTFGHPNFFFDISLEWRPGRDGSDVNRRRPSKQCGGDRLRDNLPSWSWMGWHGDTCFPWDSEFSPPALNNTYGFLNPVIKWFTMESQSSTQRTRINSQWHKYRTSARSATDFGQLPEGWTKTEYVPVKWLKRKDRHRIQNLPRDLPRFCYTHVSDPKVIYWYPVPVLVQELKNSPKLNAQTQYLYSVTTRAFVSARLGTVERQTSEHVQIVDEQGELIGILYLHRESRPRIVFRRAFPGRACGDCGGLD